MKRVISILLAICLMLTLGIQAFASVGYNHSNRRTTGRPARGFTSGKTAGNRGNTDSTGNTGNAGTTTTRTLKCFPVSTDEFIDAYDLALKNIEYSDWSISLKKDTEGSIVADKSTDIIMIPIGYTSGSAQRWSEYPLTSCFLSIERNDEASESFVSACVCVNARFLLNNYTQDRSMLLGFYSALVMALEPEVGSFDDAQKISDAAFALASGGNDIQNTHTRSLTNLPAEYEHNSVKYTVDIENGYLKMTATTT